MILLINPKTSKFSEFQKEIFREPNLGILYLAAILDLHEIPVDILDLEQYSELDDTELENVIREKALEYKIFGITSLTNTFHITLDIARIIKEQDRNNLIILGGPHVSFMYEKILKNDMQSEKTIDFICVGEAEKSFLSLIKLLISYLSKKKELKNFEARLRSIRGLAFIDSNGKLSYNPSRDEIDLEDLPLPARYKLSQENHFYIVANVIVNRGCPHQCSFCSRQQLFKKTRIRSIESILSEIRDIQSSQTYNYINFYDNVNINRRFFKNFCEMFINNEIKIPWGCELRVDTITIEEARLLKEAGCKLIATGIESASKKVLEKNFKYQDPDNVKAGIINLKKHDIPIQAYFVLGLPGETEMRFQKTIEYINGLPLDEGDKINYFVATPYPGSRLWENRKSFGINIFENDFSKYDCEHVIFKTRELNKTQLEQLYPVAKEIEKNYNKEFNNIRTG